MYHVYRYRKTVGSEFCCTILGILPSIKTGELHLILPWCFSTLDSKHWYWALSQGSITETRNWIENMTLKRTYYKSIFFLYLPKKYQHKSFCHPILKIKDPNIRVKWEFPLALGIQTAIGIRLICVNKYSFLIGSIVFLYYIPHFHVTARDYWQYLHTTEVSGVRV